MHAEAIRLVSMNFSVLKSDSEEKNGTGDGGGRAASSVSFAVTTTVKLTSRTQCKQPRKGEVILLRTLTYCVLAPQILACHNKIVEYRRNEHQLQVGISEGIKPKYKRWNVSRS